LRSMRGCARAPHVRACRCACRATRAHARADARRSSWGAPPRMAVRVRTMTTQTRTTR
jgi:hypothetical protein